VPDAFAREVHCLLGLPFDAVGVAEAAAAIRESALRRRRCVFSTPNLNFLVACRRDEVFRNSVIESDVSTADGMPLIWVARLLRVPLRERVAGSSVFERLRSDEADRMSVYFFGGPPGAADAACKSLNADSPGMRCVGFESAGFGSVEEMSADATINRINASGADFVVLALGARKGQAWIARNRDRVSAPVISHLGAVLNFVAGTVRRAPTWMQRFGLEWLWRIREEPALWRRYLGDGIAFLQLLTTRVVPYWWFMLNSRPSAGEAADANLDLIETEYETLIRLRGAWMLDNLKPLRDGLVKVALTEADVAFDMEKVTYVDSAFLGLVILLYGLQRRCGRKLRFVATAGKVRRIFRYACAEYLLETQ
jgi:N-acetylglucosaminyldiphosphoundecaprenol N-acetyl-beta-D-mannosaminyltransferase